MLNKKAFRFGLILGGLAIFLFLLIYLMGVEVMSTWWVGIILMLLIIGLAVFFSLRLKKTQGIERISYWQAFFAVFILALTAGILSSVYERTINYVDPHLLENIQNASIQKTIAMMENFGAPQEKIDETIDGMIESFEEAKNITFAGVIKKLLISFVWYAVFAFIMAIFVRKSPPVFPESGIQQSVQNQ